jgi:hypothetical protein
MTLPKSKSAKKSATVTPITAKKRGRPRKNTSELAKDFQTVMAVPATPMPTLTADPSDILLPSPEDSVKVLAELAKLNDQAQAAQAKYLDLKEKTKSAKEAYDQLAEQVLRRLHVCTHKSDLPLFSEQQERDMDRMVAGMPQDASSVANMGTPSNDQVPGAVMPLPAPDALPEGSLDDSGVF